MKQSAEVTELTKGDGTILSPTSTSGVTGGRVPCHAECDKEPVPLSHQAVDKIVPSPFVTFVNSYEQSLAILKEALQFGIDPSLVGIQALTHALDNPQNQFVSLQIAGTNGKSSTARFTAAFLHAQGKKVGLYTSPELTEYPERIEIDGKVISHETFAEAIFAAHQAAQTLADLPPITEFELLTGAALWLFAREQVDYAVLEVGLGGRWDATSVVHPHVAVITGIDFDHTDILGDTKEQIAVEKAAIIKPGTLPILGPGTVSTRVVFLARCAEVQAQPVIVEAETSLPQSLNTARFPRYQQRNIACALAACEAALASTLDLAAIQQVLDTLSIPGRFEAIREQPLLLIDASHNPESARVLAQTLIEHFGLTQEGGASVSQHPKTLDTLLLGILGNKDAVGIIQALTPLFAHIAVTQSASPRAIPAADLAQLVAQVDGRQPEVFPSVSAALKALSERGAAVVATGSITIAGEVKALAAKQQSFC